MNEKECLEKTYKLWLLLQQDVISLQEFLSGFERIIKSYEVIIFSNQQHKLW